MFKESLMDQHCWKDAFNWLPTPLEEPRHRNQSLLRHPHPLPSVMGSSQQAQKKAPGPLTPYCTVPMVQRPLSSHRSNLLYSGGFRGRSGGADKGHHTKNDLVDTYANTHKDKKKKCNPFTFNFILGAYTRPSKWLYFGTGLAGLLQFLVFTPVSELFWPEFCTQLTSSGQHKSQQCVRCAGLNDPSTVCQA